MTATHELKTYQRCTLVNVTQKVKETVRQSGVQEGMVVVYTPHTTAGITINENADPDVCTDLLASMEALVPDVKFLHVEGNSDAHLKSTLTGASATVPIHNGELMLGVWQSVYFCEYDGPRSRRFVVSVLGNG